MRLITISIEDKCSIKVPLLPSTYQSYPWLNVFVDPLLLSVLSLSSLIFISFPFFLHFFSVGAGQRTRQNSEISSTHKKYSLKVMILPWQLMKPSLSESASFTIQSRSFLFILPFMIFLSSSTERYPSLSLSKVLTTIISFHLTSFFPT